MGRVERGREIARRRTRRTKLKKLKVKLAKTDNRSDRDAVIEKIRRLSPFAPLETE